MNDSSLPRISMSNRQRAIALDRKGLEAFARRALPLCASGAAASLTTLEELSVVFVSDRRIAELHERFMQIVGPTDVITFQHGEIVISVETARRQAQLEGTSLGYELELYLVHGLLHLAGFDDQTTEARRQMQARQAAILEQLHSGSARP